MLIKNLFGTDLVIGESMYVQKIPDYNRGREIGDGNTAWAFETTDLDIIHGGAIPIP